MARFHATANGPVPFTPEEEAERDAEIAAWAADADNRLAASIREQRDQLLSATDWRVTKAAEVGTLLDPEWIVYRQALREVPQQPGFPNSITWPDIPGGA
jgi:hypothetical protein